MKNNQRSFLVMGVTGVGKTTIAGRLAVALGGSCIEGDEYHPKANIESMASGLPLTDEMRWPWLERVCSAAAAARPAPVVIACSALKRRYRDKMRLQIGPLGIIHLAGNRELIRDRMLARRNHFMQVSLVDSQFADLEPPHAPEEDMIEIDIGESPDSIVGKALEFCRHLAEPAADRGTAVL